MYVRKSWRYTRKRSDKKNNVFLVVITVYYPKVNAQKDTGDFATAMDTRLLL